MPILLELKVHFLIFLSLTKKKTFSLQKTVSKFTSKTLTVVGPGLSRQKSFFPNYKHSSLFVTNKEKGFAGLSPARCSGSVSAHGRAVAGVTKLFFVVI